MKIKWLGHSAFAFSLDSGPIIITDPFDSSAYNGAIKYPKIDIKADIVTYSHNHPDHCNRNLPGRPRVFDQPGDYNISGIKIKGVPTFHDASQGRQRGANIVFVFDMDGMRIAHLGDLGHVPTAGQIKEIGRVDVVLIPVGGYFTINAIEAVETAAKLCPGIIIPMHYKTGLIDFPISPADDFLSRMSAVRRFDSNEVAVIRASLPPNSEVYVPAVPL
ncbi:MAG: MBL fold metallo-hydrolase [Planctomycetota bacterium]